MSFKEGEMDFQEADRRYDELKRQYEARDLTNKEFDAELKRLMVQDDEGRWWAKSRESGRWYYNDGNDWVASTPPGYQTPPQTFPTEDMQDHRTQPEQVEQPPSESQGQDQRSPRSRPEQVEQTPPSKGQVRDDRPLHPQSGQTEQPPPPLTPTPGSPPIQDQNGGQRRRRLPRWVMLAAPVAVLALVGLFVVILVLGRDPQAPDPQAPGPQAPDLVEAPDLVGQTQDSAEQSAGEDFEIKASSERVGDEPKGTILSQDPGPDEQAEQGSTISVVVSAGQPPNPGDIFEDDFSSTSSGWPRRVEGDAIIDYVDGSYRIKPPPQGITTSRIRAAGTDIEEAIVEVDATRTGEAPGEVSGWGIVCGFVDNENYYRMGITSEGGSFLIGIRDGEPSVRQTSGPSDAVRTGEGATNHIRVDCGSMPTLYVNDQEVQGGIGSSEFGSGQVGLFVDNNAEEPPGTDVLFDNFLVSTP